MAPWFPACRPKKNDNFSQKNWAEKKAGANGRVNPRIHYTSVPADFLLRHSHHSNTPFLLTPDS
jgi:hypothetical protein